MVQSIRFFIGPSIIIFIGDREIKIKLIANIVCVHMVSVCGYVWLRYATQWSLVSETLGSVSVYFLSFTQ